LADELLRQGVPLKTPETGVAVVGTAAGFTALFSAAACCILPLVFAALGLGAGGLAAFVPYHWPLTIASAVAVSIGWLLYLRKRRGCAAEAECASAPPRRATLVLLCIATAAVALAAAWPRLIEQPLMRLLGGA
jgi:mercuric ion transport protein